MTERKLFRAHDPDAFSWNDVERLPYKEEGSAPFRAISRQVLFSDSALPCELRYFEMQAGGYSTLERHEHVHAVMILRGTGRCLVGRDVRAVKPYDLVTIPPMTWHQFRATDKEPLGFICMVKAERDRPQLPTAEERRALETDPKIKAFLSGDRPAG